jgi:PncC family amidohydrolase
MKRLANTLFELNKTISSCESFTGGLFASSLTSISGISSVYKGSVVSYSNEVKIDVLGINHNLIQEFGAISEQVAIEMALSTKRLLNTDICISFTGNAGPNPMEGKEVGLCYIAVAVLEQVHVFKIKFKGTRNQLRRSAVNYGSKQILEILRTNALHNVI